MYSRKKSDSTASSHSEAAEMKDLCSGFLYKSPPSGQIRKMKSWKRRFFVLEKTNNGSHELQYYKTTEKDKAIKSIEVSSITLLYVGPESHSAFEWISKTFKCSSSSVLFMKAENPTDKVQREYFFIGDSSEEVNRWFNAIFGVLKNFKTESQTKPQTMTESTDKNPCDTDKSQVVSRPTAPPRTRSFEIVTSHPEQCCQQPPNRNRSETKVIEKEESLDETGEESNEELSSEESGIGSSEDSLLTCVTQVFNNLKTQEESTECDNHITQSTTISDTTNTNSCTDFSGNSETHTFVEKEISLSACELRNLVFSEETGRLCMKGKKREVSCQLHEGDQILAVNDLLTYTVEDIHLYIKKLFKGEVKFTILRLPDSIPMCSES
ncbi:pleckstrin homology domain-containing family S member 1 [Danio aesculapii]|uniref:pleckstrin homology domain-containing family S member 1 n=1 Tax=Danio aesculapii TaxID=1142201 RepID=UPI0024BFE053|nr:pleckstrin homology domain-containing family S member 1 [Danio aesculapii]